MTAPTIPTNASELEELISDRDRVEQIIKEGQFKDLITNYTRAVNKHDADLAEQVRAEVQRVTAEFLRDNPDADIHRPSLDPTNAIPAQRGTGYNRKAPGAKVDAAKLFDDPAEFFANTWHRARGDKAAQVQDKLHDIRNSFGSSVPADGGFLIPESLRSELLRVSLESAVVRPRARVIPMDSLTVPFPTIDSTSNASNVYGGITAYWTEEAGALTESSATFGRIKLEAKKLTAYTEVPNELFQDSIISLAAFINDVFPEALAWFEDIAFMRGTGVGEPLGFLNTGNAAAVAVAKETGQAADTILWENIVKMYARMLPTSLARAVWIAHIDTFPELATMALSVGTGGSAVWLSNGVSGPPMSILGRPVFFTEKAETLGDAGDINFADLGYYLIGDRQTMQADSSPHYKFANDLTSMRFIERVDGTPWIKNPITPNKGTNTLSPFVKIAARA